MHDPERAAAMVRKTVSLLSFLVSRLTISGKQSNWKEHSKAMIDRENGTATQLRS